MYGLMGRSCSVRSCLVMIIRRRLVFVSFCMRFFR